MTVFRFLHAADLHLGSPFRGLAVKDPDVARRFAEAGRRAFSDLVSRAIEQEVAFAVIAGDVYDGDWKDNSIGLFFNRELARLDRVGIPIFLLKGNHDAESVITGAITLPSCVTHFTHDAPSTHRLEHLRVALHGRSFAKRAETENFALRYPDPVRGWFNIGVLHTSLDGRENHANYAPASAEHLIGRGYDYWALGHVHDYEVVSKDPWIVFPGNLQGRSIREPGAKGAVIVAVVDGRVSSVERLIVDGARWASLELDLAGANSFEAIYRLLESALEPLAEAAGERLLALRLTLKGATTLHRQLAAQRGQLRDELEAAGQRVYADLWIEKLLLSTSLRSEAQVPANLAGLLGEIDPMEAAVLRDLGEDLIRQVGDKMPGTLLAEREALLESLPGLLAEAEALLLQRLTNKP